MQDDIEARVRAIITALLAVRSAAVLPDAQIVRDLGADSLDTMEIVMALEREFDCTITDSEAETVITVADAIALVRAKTK